MVLVDNVNHQRCKGLTSFASPGNWNDPDFLIAGADGLTAGESRSQVALWAVMAAPRRRPPR
ncbi:hypothetical protein [Streptomyces sp. Amel2xC10]|uniref:hypothetical protein n=1 Tax=Streptomyces sp. Amel2xC10 TaxID=1305826 RepID=UPI00277B532D|nr:hypothetical protein [Streptomyces sp. Amel2xC10]